MKNLSESILSSNGAGMKMAVENWVKENTASRVLYGFTYTLKGNIIECMNMNVNLDYKKGLTPLPGGLKIRLIPDVANRGTPLHIIGFSDNAGAMTNPEDIFVKDTQPFCIMTGGQGIKQEWLEKFAVFNVHCIKMQSSGLLTGITDLGHLLKTFKNTKFVISKLQLAYMYKATLPKQVKDNLIIEECNI